jgi:ribosome recycling factor
MILKKMWQASPQAQVHEKIETTVRQERLGLAVSKIMGSIPSIRPQMEDVTKDIRREAARRSEDAQREIRQAMRETPRNS